MYQIVKYLSLRPTPRSFPITIAISNYILNISFYNEKKLGLGLTDRYLTDWYIDLCL